MADVQKHVNLLYTSACYWDEWNPPQENKVHPRSVKAFLTNWVSTGLVILIHTKKTDLHLSCAFEGKRNDIISRTKENWSGLVKNAPYRSLYHRAAYISDLLLIVKSKDSFGINACLSTFSSSTILPLRPHLSTSTSSRIKLYILDINRNRPVSSVSCPQTTGRLVSCWVSCGTVYLYGGSILSFKNFSNRSC